MGALTLKHFSFELRGWDIKKVKSCDPTDGFCLNTFVFLNKNEIVQIESNSNDRNCWLNDKARYFFDSIFKKLPKQKKLKKQSWLKTYFKILKIIYIFEHCHNQTSKNYFFTVLFDSVSIEMLAMLIIVTQNYSFIRLKKVQFSVQINNDLETNFQLNKLTFDKTLITSNLCLLIATNPRYEGSTLNLNLRQRVLKKNFKCIIIGSLINLTFPTTFLGSNISVIKTIAEGNNFICQNFNNSTNSFLVCNSELFKRNDWKTIYKMFNTLFYLHLFNKTWYGVTILNASMHDTGIFVLGQSTKFKLKDLNSFSCLYFINVTACKVAVLKKITELQLFQQQLQVTKKALNKNYLLIDQSHQIHSNFKISNKILSNYLYLPVSTFYENESIYINTEGFIKKTTKIISKHNLKNNWQLLRKLLKYFKNKLVCFYKKNNQTLFFSSNKLYNFRNFIHFYSYPTKKIANLSYYLNIKNKSFVINIVPFNLKTKSKKFSITKLKYWINDFFNNKNQYSQNSFMLTNCSVYVKKNLTNFF